jgi:hypothetical protein
MVVSRHQNVGEKYGLLIFNKSFENVAKFKNLVIKITYQNFIHEETKTRLNFGNSYYQSVQNLLFSVSCLKFSD